MSGLNTGGIAKTTKLFINGEFPRTESGRSFTVNLKDSDQAFANLCQGSRKDLRMAVEAAQKAQPSWAKRTAYNRAQILYRMAEMLEGKATEVTSTLKAVTGMDSEASVQEAIQNLVYYAGFADKYSQVMASVNPVSGPYHNFTTPEPMGVVAMVYDGDFDFPQWIAQIAAVVASGNTLVVVWDAPGAAILSEMGEVFKTSDLPAGVINLISGHVDELASHLGSHMEVQALLYSGSNSDRLKGLREQATDNMKRTIAWSYANRSLEPLVAFTEAKTVWHPVGI